MYYWNPPFQNPGSATEVVELSLVTVDHDQLENQPDEKIDDTTIMLFHDVSGRSFSRRTYEGSSGYASIDLSFHVSVLRTFMAVIV